MLCVYIYLCIFSILRIKHGWLTVHTHTPHLYLSIYSPYTRIAIKLPTMTKNKDIIRYAHQFVHSEMLFHPSIHFIQSLFFPVFFVCSVCASSQISRALAHWLAACYQTSSCIRRIPINADCIIADEQTYHDDRNAIVICESTRNRSFLFVSDQSIERKISTSD